MEDVIDGVKTRFEHDYDESDHLTAKRKLIDDVLVEYTTYNRDYK